MFLRKLIITAFFILQGNVLSTLGIPSEYITYILLVIGFFIIIRSRNSFKSIEWKITLLFLFLLGFRYFTGILPESFRYACNLVIPCLVSFALPNTMSATNKKIYILAFKLLCLFFAAEIIIATYETITHSHLLTWIDSTYESHLDKIKTRPIGLVGAPLASSHILATLSFFILNSPLKQKYKYTLWSINLIGLLLYQGRMGILFTIIYFIFYMFIELKNRQISIARFTGIMTTICLITIILLSLGLGSRLFTEDDGGSADMRLGALTFFDTFSWKNFLIGTPYKNMDIIRETLGVRIIEMFILCHFILFGILFSIFFYILYIKLYLRIYKNNDKILKVITIIAFFTLEATSISWFSTYEEVTFFLLMAKLLNTTTLILLIPPKYINRNKL